jgi:hypothetical protein
MIQCSTIIQSATLPGEHTNLLSPLKLISEQKDNFLQDKMIDQDRLWRSGKLTPASGLWRSGKLTSASIG